MRLNQKLLGRIETDQDIFYRAQLSTQSTILLPLCLACETAGSGIDFRVPSAGRNHKFLPNNHLITAASMAGMNTNLAS